jgi:cell division protein FtsL
MARRVTRGWSPRAVVAAVLLSFVLVATGVIWRRSYGIREQRAIRDLERQRDALEAERVRLTGEIRDSSSLARLAPILQRMNMHVPADSTVITLPRPRPHDQE